MPADLPLTKSTVVAGFVESVVDLGRELEAWRRFGQDVSDYLQERGESEQFSAWQEKRRTERTKKRGRAKR